jgi:membrane fusion protein, multidrug efflux system
MNMMEGHRFLKGSTSLGFLPVIICAGLAMLVLTGCGKEKKAAEAAPEVEVAEVIQKDIPINAEWVGTLDGYVNATIRAQVTGYLTRQHYHEGDFVKKDQLLFQIDPRPFQAAFEEAKGQLDNATARWNTAKATLTRIKPLAAQKAVSEKDLDDAVGAEESTRASVATTKANLDKARLNLEWTRVTSPVDGIAGIAKAQMGNLVGPGQVEELTTVSTMDPIKVYISISEIEYMKAIEKQDAEKRRGVRSKALPLELILGDGTVWPHKGEFFVADRQVDVRTGTIRVAALFKNPGYVLRPGQFARVRAMVELQQAAIVVPRRAVTQLQGQYLVAVVGVDNKVSIKNVKAGTPHGQLWVVDEGLKAGEKVVAEGAQKVRDGMVVTPKPFSPPAEAKPEAASKPESKPHGEPKPAKR